MMTDRYLSELLVAIAAGEALTNGELRDLALEVLRLRRAVGQRGAPGCVPSDAFPLHAASASSDATTQLPGGVVFGAHAPTSALPTMRHESP